MATHMHGGRSQVESDMFTGSGVLGCTASSTGHRDPRPVAPALWRPLTHILSVSIVQA